MSFVKKTLFLLALSTAPLLALGCGKQSADDPEWMRRKGELTDIYEIYTMFVKKNQQPPRQASDLMQKASEVISPAGVRALQNDAYVVVWGIDPGQAASRTVLAYEKDAPNQGGAVLLADGSVKHFTAEQVQAAVKNNG